MKLVKELTDEEIENCVDGSSSVSLIREICERCLNGDGTVCDEDFAQEFAEAIQGFISEDEGTDEYDEAWENNYEWGASIADSINRLLAGEESDD